MIICYFSRVWVHWLDLLLWAVLTPAAVISWDLEIIQRFSGPLLPGFFSQKAPESKRQRRCPQVLFQESLLIWWGKQITLLGSETEQRRIQDAEQKETSLIWTMKETDLLRRENTRNRWFSSRALSKSSVFSTTYSPWTQYPQGTSNAPTSIHASPLSLMQGQYGSFSLDLNCPI